MKDELTDVEIISLRKDSLVTLIQMRHIMRRAQLYRVAALITDELRRRGFTA